MSIWLRAEPDARERRTPLSPDDSRKLIEAGFVGTYQYSLISVKTLIYPFWQFMSRSLVKELLRMKNMLMQGMLFDMILSVAYFTLCS